MKQVKRYNFFGFLSKKGGIYNKIYNNLQSTGRWLKSLGPVFILRVLFLLSRFSGAFAVLMEVRWCPTL